MTDFGMKLVTLKSFCSFRHEKFCCARAEDLLHTTNNDPHFQKQFITEVKSWVYDYYRDSKAQFFPENCLVLYDQPRSCKIEAMCRLHYFDCVFLL